jgi:hypothetical protein
MSFSKSSSEIGDSETGACGEPVQYDLDEMGAELSVLHRRFLNRCLRVQ